MNSCLEGLIQRFEAAGVPFTVEEHPSAFTAQRVADLEHVPGHIFAKAVVVLADGSFILLALPAPHEVFFPGLKQELGLKEVRLATAEEFGPLFPDCELGAMPPFPGASQLPVYVEKSLLGHPEIVFQAGSNVQSVRMRTEDYVWLVQPTIARFGREPEPGAASR